MEYVQQDSYIAAKGITFSEISNIPEEVYEQEGKLYLVAGQGPDGDYYGEQGFCSGLYESEHKGIT